MITSHMPENHRQYLTYTKDDFQSWASTIGPNAERIEETCRQILMFSGAPSIRGIQALLKSPVKRDGKTDSPSTQRPNRHRSRGFTRGAEQFREGGDEK